MLLLLAVGALAIIFAVTAACGANGTSGSRQVDVTANSPVLKSSTLAPGVAVDPGRERVYIMRPAGGIESLDLMSGDVQWISEHADQPLFVSGGNLLARVESAANVLTVLALDPDSGEPAANADEPLILPLPAGVRVGIDQTLGRTFRHSVTGTNGEIVLTWEYIEQDVTGVAPPAGRPFMRREEGAFRYLGGRFEAASAEPVSVSTEDWPGDLEELYASKRIRHAPWKTAGLLAIAQQHYRPDRLVLRRWRQNDGESLEDKTLFEGRALAVLASCDERHIVVSVPSGRPALEPQYLLHYYALASGDRVAEVSSRRSVAPFCVSDSRLLSVSQPETRRENGELISRPLELLAVDLASGAEVWRRELRDTAFRGTPPPRN